MQPSSSFSFPKMVYGYLSMLIVFSFITQQEYFSHFADRNLGSSDSIHSTTSESPSTLTSPSTTTTTLTTSCTADLLSNYSFTINQTIPPSSSLLNVLPLALDCSTANEANTTHLINYFASAVGKHEGILPMYAFFALNSASNSNQDAVVEVVVDDRLSFIQKHQAALGWLLENFGIRSICVREFHHQTREAWNRINGTKVTTPNTLRYLEIPVRKAKYTYIGDVDIFLTEPVVEPRRLAQMEYFGLPYSNVIRSNTTKLTGLMLMKTASFYTPAYLEAQRTINPVGINDEAVLYKLVNSSGLGLPETPTSGTINHGIEIYRPLHGIHLSLNRGPGRIMCLTDWQTERGLKEWCDAFVHTGATLQNYLHYDAAGQSFLNKALDIAKEQVKYSMTVKNDRKLCLGMNSNSSEGLSTDRF